MVAFLICDDPHVPGNYPNLLGSLQVCVSLAENTWHQVLVLQAMLQALVLPLFCKSTLMNNDDGDRDGDDDGVDDGGDIAKYRLSSHVITSSYFPAGSFSVRLH